MKSLLNKSICLSAIILTMIILSSCVGKVIHVDVPVTDGNLSQEGTFNAKSEEEASENSLEDDKKDQGEHASDNIKEDDSDSTTDEEGPDEEDGGTQQDYWHSKMGKWVDGTRYIYGPDDKLQSYNLVELDENGNITYSAFYYVHGDNKEKSTWDEYEYDDKGRRTCLKHYTAEKDLVLQENIKYSETETGYIVDREVISITNKNVPYLASREEYEDNKLVSKVYYNPDGSVKVDETQTSATEGSKKDVVIEGTGDDHYKTEVVEENGKILRQIQDTGYGPSTVEYENDENGRVTYEKRYDGAVTEDDTDAKPQRLLRYEYEEVELGKRIVRKYTYDGYESPETFMGREEQEKIFILNKE